MLDKKKYLITGAAGFVGHHLVKKILDDEEFAVGIDNYHFGRREYLQEFSSNPNFKMYEGSITNSELIKKIVHTEKPAVIFHLAALHFIPYCMAHPAETLEVNLVGTQTLIDSLQDSSVNKFVFISTGDVYKPSNKQHRETDSLEPFNIYGLSKLMGEQLINLAEKVCPDIKFNIVRLFNVYGPGETNPHILPDIINLLKKGRTLNLGNITPIRDYILIDDVVEGLLRISNYLGPEKVFNLSGGTTCSVQILVEIISQILNEKIEIIIDQ